VCTGDHLKRITHVVVHEFDGLELLNQGPSATVFIEEDHQADQNGDQQIVDSYGLGVKTAVLQNTVEQPAQGVDREPSEKTGQQGREREGDFACKAYKNMRTGLYVGKSVEICLAHASAFFRCHAGPE
jgi:hypothetical protein